MNRGKHAEAIVGEPHVIAIARCAGGNYSRPGDFTNQTRLERLNQLLLFRHAPNPAIRFNSHSIKSRVLSLRVKERAENMKFVTRRQVLSEPRAVATGAKRNFRRGK